MLLVYRTGGQRIAEHHLLFPQSSCALRRTCFLKLTLTKGSKSPSIHCNIDYNSTYCTMLTAVVLSFRVLVVGLSHARCPTAVGSSSQATGKNICWYIHTSILYVTTANTEEHLCWYICTYHIHKVYHRGFLTRTSSTLSKALSTTSTTRRWSGE